MMTDFPLRRKKRFTAKARRTQSEFLRQYAKEGIRKNNTGVSGSPHFDVRIPPVLHAASRLRAERAFRPR
jgi:hypothetical protein